MGEASYAAVPHLVRIAQNALRRDWNLYGLVALIEIERHRKSNPPIPDWLASDYEAAWREISLLALEDLGNCEDPGTARSALSVVAIARGQMKLGALLNHFDDSEVDELVEERLAWSNLYA